MKQSAVYHLELIPSHAVPLQCTGIDAQCTGIDAPLRRHVVAGWRMRLTRQRCTAGPPHAFAPYAGAPCSPVIADRKCSHGLQAYSCRQFPCCIPPGNKLAPHFNHPTLTCPCMGATAVAVTPACQVVLAGTHMHGSSCGVSLVLARIHMHGSRCDCHPSMLWPHMHGKPAEQLWLSPLHASWPWLAPHSAASATAQLQFTTIAGRPAAQ